MTPTGSLVAFEQDGRDLHVRDELEDQSLTLTADADISPRPALPDLFHFPVDRAVSFSTATLTIGAHASVFLRDEAGDIVAQPGEEPKSFPQGTYYLDVSGAVKTYVRIPNTAPTIVHTGKPYESPVRVSFQGERTVTVGARSMHSRPEATITVPDDPEAMMEAFSYLGSSIKEFSPERSWPTLRGHPPAFERGDELHVPEHLSKPDTGFTVTVPANYADLYRVAPLAFYFGATVEAGEPALHFPNGYVERLGAREETLETAVERLVGVCFLLDTLARQDGYNPVPLTEYDVVAPHLPFYPESLAAESFVTQLMEFLEAPTAPVLDVLPSWTTTAVVRPVVEDAPILPHLLDRMARVRVAETPPTARSVRESSPSSPITVGYTHPEVPDGGAGFRLTAFERRLMRDSPTIDDVQVAVVTEDDAQTERLSGLLATVSGRPSPDAVSFTTAPTRAELRGLLAGDADLVFCGLRATTEGIVCSDGVLAPEAIGSVEPPLLILDAPTRGDEGDVSIEATFAAATALVDRGAIAGMAARAATTPVRFAGLLTCLVGGCDLSSTAGYVYGDDGYRLVGDPTTALGTLDGLLPASCYHVNSISPDKHRVTMETHPTASWGLGSAHRGGEDFCPEAYQLMGSTVQMPGTITTEQVVDLLSDDDYVIVLNGELYDRREPAEPTLVQRSARRALDETASPESEFGPSPDL